jgi:predicted dienelactone hydrolase
MLSKYSWLIVFLAFLCKAQAQPFAVGKRTVQFTDPARSNRAIAADLFYPAASAGNNTPLPPGTSSFALVVFGHGFLIPATSYSWLGDSLSRQGFIVAFPNTEGTASPDHAAFGEDIAFLSRFLPTLTDSSGSFLQGRINNRVAAGGHSMGGGASFLGTSGNQQIQALFNFAAAETNPSGKAAATAVQIPALIFAGSRDCIVPDSNQRTMYQRIPYPCKTFVNITDALHCHFANNNGTCTAGQFFSGCNSSPISAATVFQKSTQLLIPFLQYYLNDSCEAKQQFENRLSSLTGISYQRNCTTDSFTCPFTEYLFRGNGKWSNPLNWQYHRVPPPLVPGGYTIRIQPAANGTCVLDRRQDLAPGASLLIEAGKALIIPGELGER